MTEEQAIDLVFELISAVRELEIMNTRSNRQTYETLRERIIKALVSPAEKA